MNVLFYFLKQYLRRDIDNKSSMDLRVYFLLFPSALKKDLRRNIDNKSSMDVVVYLLKLLIDI